jgi:hypothetical protein
MSIYLLLADAILALQLLRLINVQSVKAIPLSPLANAFYAVILQTAHIV